MLLKELSEAFGVSGAEDEVRNILKRELKETCSIETDSLGNLICKNLDKKNKLNLMLCAHMDEVGLMIRSIDKNGWLKFDTVGGIDDRILVSKQVVIGPQKIKGVIGAKAIHLQEPKERDIPLKSKNLYIEIGAKDREDAEKKVRIGDFATFDTEFEVLGNNIVKGKALDDRVGCYIIAETLKKKLGYSITGAFTVQEEIGVRGSAVVSYRINPDVAIVVEGTFASDVPETKEENYSTTIGMGPAITIMDMTYVASKELVTRVLKLADSNGIPCQLRRTTFGGTDGGRIHTSREGIPTIIVSVPCRYIHSPVSFCSLLDIKHTMELLEFIIKDLEERGL
ncbi:MAG TPA: M42 family metallopeptidase [Thermoanaerobacterales bacterium]|nr:M42 family metallopeptidase [Thermoanaerobacterales bacterium]